MTQFLLDTDILVDFFKKRPYAQHLLADIKGKGNIFLSILSVSELRAGWTEEEASYFLPILYTIAERASITDEVAERAGAMRQVYKSRGISLPTIDTLIAATAILGNYQLVTNNKKHYPFTELHLYPQTH